MSFRELLQSFKSQRAIVLGDLMLDEYLHGHASRISPEAPVMVVKHEKTERLPGGAANVARNIRALGAEVTLIGVTGADETASFLATSLRETGLQDFALIADESRPTSRKTRVLADHAHQVLRIDSEEDHPIASDVEEQLFAAFNGQVSGASVVVLSDYLKGGLTPSLVKKVIQSCQQKGIPVVANPKPQSAESYAGADLLSLNRLEASIGAGLRKSATNEQISSIAPELLQKYSVKHLLITLGEAGMLAVGENQYRVTSPKVEVYDTAGAGDTVIATVALGMATTGFSKEIFELAAQTSACVVRHVGVATPTQSDLVALSELP